MKLWKLKRWLKQFTLKGIREKEADRIIQLHIDALNDYGQGKISQERLSDILDINPYELQDAFMRFHATYCAQQCGAGNAKEASNAAL